MERDAKIFIAGHRGMVGSAIHRKLQKAGFDNFALQALVGPVFDKIASSLVEAFVKRAEQVYGSS